MTPREGVLQEGTSVEVYAFGEWVASVVGDGEATCDRVAKSRRSGPHANNLRRALRAGRKVWIDGPAIGGWFKREHVREVSS